MKVDHGRLAQIRAWDGGDGEIADQIAVEEAIALLTRVRVLIPTEKPARGGPTEAVAHDDLARCPYCGGDQNRCDFSFHTEHCSQMEPVFVSFDAGKQLTRSHGPEGER